MPKRYLITAESFLPNPLGGGPHKVASLGEIVYEYHGPTYGVVSPDGIPVTREPNQTPFFEVPRSHLQELGDDDG